MIQLADGIRKHGFKKWYERELLRGHAHLVAVIACTLGVMMALEASTRMRSTVDQLIDLLTVILCSGTGVWALRRYLYLLLRAENIANQADCPRCKVYGRLELARPAALSGQGATAKIQRLTVRCRACAHEWDIHD